MKPQIEEKKAALVACYDLKTYLNQVSEFTDYFKPTSEDIDIRSIAVESIKFKQEFIEETIDFLTQFISEVNPQNISVRQMIRIASEKLSMPA